MKTIDQFVDEICERVVHASRTGIKDLVTNAVAEARELVAGVEPKEQVDVRALIARADKAERDLLLLIEQSRETMVQRNAAITRANEAEAEIRHYHNLLEIAQQAQRTLEQRLRDSQDKALRNEVNWDSERRRADGLQREIDATQTHGVHHDWVFEEKTQRERAEAVERARDAFHELMKKAEQERDELRETLKQERDEVSAKLARVYIDAVEQERAAFKKLFGEPVE